MSESGDKKQGRYKTCPVALGSVITERWLRTFTRLVCKNTNRRSIKLEIFPKIHETINTTTTATIEIMPIKIFDH
jgi:hypothetical protein